jgi:membrane-associated protease RseP (regulator of RpoE activity)
VSLSRFRFGLAGFGFAFAFGLSGTVVHSQEGREIVIERVVVDEKAHDDQKRNDQKDQKDDARPVYWIGIALEGPESLTIADVLPESPALEAGLKAGDIVASVGEKKLERLEQLVDLIQDSEGKPLELQIVREGKEVTIHVKPGKRPARAPEPKDPQPSPVAPPAIRFTDPQRPDAGGSSFPPSGGSSARPTRARLALQLPPALPDDMQVTITKKGSRAAVVVAKQGEKVWKTTENELGMLPPAAQAYAARILGQDVLRGRMQGGAPGVMPGMGGGMGGLAPRPMQAFELRLDKDQRDQAKEEVERTSRIRALQQQAQRLREQLNELREEVKE